MQRNIFIAELESHKNNMKSHGITSVGRMADIEGGQVADCDDLEAPRAVRALVHLGRTIRAQHVLAGQSRSKTEVLHADSALNEARHRHWVDVRRRKVAVLRSLARWRSSDSR